MSGAEIARALNRFGRDGLDMMGGRHWTASFLITSIVVKRKEVLQDVSLNYSVMNNNNCFMKVMKSMTRTLVATSVAWTPLMVIQANQAKMRTLMVVQFIHNKKNNPSRCMVLTF